MTQLYASESFLIFHLVSYNTAGYFLNNTTLSSVLVYYSIEVHHGAYGKLQLFSAIQGMWFRTQNLIFCSLLTVKDERGITQASTRHGKFTLHQQIKICCERAEAKL